MVFRIFTVLFLAVAVAGGAAPGFVPAALADGPGAEDDQPRPRGTQPGSETGSGTGTNTGSSPAQSTGTGMSTAPRGAGPCATYKQSKIRKIRDVQTKIAGYARKDKLKGLATTKKRLENFVRQINKMGDGYSGSKSIQFNLIFLQLRCYANQKQDKALRKWAAGILKAFGVINLRDIAEAKRAKVKTAIEGNNPLSEAFGRAEYSDARGDFHRAVKKLPPEMQALFDPMPKDPAK